jgi:peptidoglycan/LPS O-acetylase OafA/YrhL
MTLLGRGDQLLLGMVAFELARDLSRKTAWIVLATAAFLVFGAYHWIDLAGGAQDAFPAASKRAHWIWLPLFEGAVYGCIVASYAVVSAGWTGAVSRSLAAIGELSYSIYLIHWILVAEVLHRFLPTGATLGDVVVAGTLFFGVVVAVSALTWRCIEQPFLRYRRPYLLLPAERGSVVPDLAGSAARGS